MKPTLNQVIHQTADYYRVSRADLIGRGRQHSICWVRAVAIYLARELTDETLATIGKAFGRDHTTAMHLEHLVRGRIFKGSEVEAQTNVLRLRLTGTDDDARDPVGCA